ncbi:MAG: response regulator [Luminiphilus sp.]|nr:response regulator [Luminiphilus sp.]
MMNSELRSNVAGTVLLVEDDQSLRSALSSALKVRNIDYLEFESAEGLRDTLTGPGLPQPACMLLDIRLGNGPTGLTVFDHIKRDGLETRVPVIFMTGHGDLDTAVDVMRDGAFDFVTKPFSTPDLIKKIEAALLSSSVAVDNKNNQASLITLLEQLTDKETEVMKWMVQGKTNREIAEICGNSTRTVELHRARVFDKLHVSNAVELVRVLSILDT